jgi:hypothetical protein
MLGLLRKIFGKDSHPASSNPEGVERRATPRTSAASVLAAKSEEAEAAPAVEENADTAEEPELSLEEPLPSAKGTAPGGDPYDTGTFNQPNVWKDTGK